MNSGIVLILKQTDISSMSAFQSPPSSGLCPCLLDMVSLVSFSRIEDPEIAVPIICLELVLMMDHFSRLEFPT